MATSNEYHGERILMKEDGKEDTENKQLDTSNEQKNPEDKIQYKSTRSGKQWKNPEEWKTWKIPNKFEFLKEVKMKTHLDKSDIPKSEELDKTLPILSVDFEKLANPPDDKIQVLWIGHASVLVQFDGISILCDPVFSKFCGPSYPTGFKWMSNLFSCKRYRDVPCKISDLSGNKVKIDVVLISHDHYDHLDSDSIVDMIRHFPEAKYVVPRGIGEWLKDSGCKTESVVDLEWNQKQTLVTSESGWEFEVEGSKRKELITEKEKKVVSIISCPAQHWCQRGINDLNKRLWCSWAVIGPTKRFYFGGDTGYCDVFKQIGEAYGPFSLAALPIGAYEPRSYMHPQHVDPEQAVKIHQDIQAEKSLGIHWGTFKQLGCFEHYLEPRTKVKKQLLELGLPEDTFQTIQHGEIWTI